MEETTTYKMRKIPGSAISVWPVAVLVVLGLLSTVQQGVMAAEVYNVGDGGGWTTNVNYSEWAAQYTFHEGDSVVFLYSRGAHDVLRVSQKDYLDCAVSNPIETDASGETAYVVREGSYYFICGFPAHCQLQQKVFFHVLPALEKAPQQLPGGDIPAYTQSAEGPSALTAFTPSNAPSAASSLQPYFHALLVLIIGVLAVQT